MTNSEREFLTDRYAQMWDGAIESVRAGDINVDPLLARREADQRRCLTVLARPSIVVQQSVNAFLEELRQTDPEQYYYDLKELHITVLSLFTATLDFQKHVTQFDAYFTAVNSALADARAFTIEFTGVTLTKDAIMIQGFPGTPTLNIVRDNLRRELRKGGLADGLDGRYVLKTAHMTVARFRHPLRDSQRFSDLLTRFRDHSFGEAKVGEVHLVRNDWYMSNH